MSVQNGLMEVYKPRSVLVTGGCGFIGSNFINYIFDKWADARIVNYDKMLRGSSIDNIDERIRESERYSLVLEDLQHREILLKALLDHKIDTIVHFAAITHVDDSYADRVGTIGSNVLCMTNLLEVCAQDYRKLRRFIHISTDEVYGDSHETEVPKTEFSYPKPTNPYSASKSACEAILSAYQASYKIPAVMVRMNNVYGPHQSTSKLIPKFITLASEQNPYPLMGDGRHTRSWIYVTDCCEAIRLVSENSEIGEIYNIGTDFEIENIELTKLIHEEVARQQKREAGPIRLAPVADRPYHDRRYYIDFTKIREQVGWSCKVDIHQGVRETVKWYLEQQANNGYYY